MPRLSLEEILDLLKNVSPGSGYYTASCPAHDDANPSLSVREDEKGRVRLKCFAGCSRQAILTALGRLHGAAGLTVGRERSASQVSPNPSLKDEPANWPALGKVATFESAKEAVDGLSRTLGSPSTVFDYTDAKGTLIGQVIRWDSDNRRKTFRQTSRVGEVWVPKAMPAPRPLYRRVDLGCADRVFIVEGEKCVEALRSIGLVATTSPGGSGAADKADWGPLSGKASIVVCPDNDPAGQAYGERVIEAIRRLPAPPRLNFLKLPELEEGGDIADFVDSLLKQGMSNAQICGAIENRILDETEAVPEIHGRRGIELVSFQDIQTELIDWIWRGRLARGMLTLIAGDPDQGKSFLTSYIAAQISSGAHWPDGIENRAPKGDVILMSPEDSASHTIKPRLEAAGADTRHVLSVALPSADPKGTPSLNPVISLDSQFGLIEEALSLVENPVLLVIDPISAFLGRINGYKDTEVRGVLGKLQGLAARYRMGILLVIHLNKDVASPKRAIQRVMGSMAFVAAARLAFLVAPDPEDKDLRLLLNSKNNIGSPTPGLGFRFIEEETPGSCRIQWDREPVLHTADEALSAMTPHFPRKATELTHAIEFLELILAQGPLPQKEVMATAKERGISEKTLQRASVKLDVVKSKNGYQGVSIWGLRHEGGQILPIPGRVQGSLLNSVSGLGNANRALDT